MKKILFIAFIGLLASCNGYKISGEAKGIADGTKVFLEKQDPKLGVVVVDTVKMLKGIFTFKGKATEPEIHNVRFENQQGNFILIVEKGDIKAIVNKDSISKAKISGTINNDELMKYNGSLSSIQKRMAAFEQNNMAAMQAANEKKDTLAINALRKEYSKFQDEYSSTNAKYIKDNPKSFLSLLFVEGMFGQQEPNYELIKKSFDGLDSEYKNTKPGKSVSEKLAAYSNVAIGKKAPEFSAPDTTGKMTSLKQSLGKVTIVDFWASWCEPCRAESPNMVAIYNDLHAKGLNIIGVSLDKKGEANKWKEAIAADHLNWTQVSNLLDWEDPISKMYNLNSIPAVFVLDKNGVIVAKNLYGIELRAKVEELLAK